jgi:hypothetical protein
MAGKARGSVNSSADEDLASREIRATDTVGAVLEAEPRLLNDFLQAGFTTLASEYARQTMARVVTLRQACRRVGVDESEFVAQLNASRHQLRSRQLPIINESLGHLI